MAENWPGAVLLLDRELSAVWMNGHAARLIGRRTGAGVPWSDLGLPWTPGTELRNRLLGGERVRLEGAQADGRRVAATLIPLQEPATEVSAIACLLSEAAPAQRNLPEPDDAASQRLPDAAPESMQGGMKDQQDAMRTQARILETMQEGLVLIDAASGIVKLTNPMFARMFGYESKDELLGRSVESLFSTRALQRSRAGLAAGDTTATEVLPVELECARKDGTRFVAACVLTPLRMAGANHWLAVFNDVTERKRLEKEIIEISNREQQRIGSDLHDGLGQELTGIALMLRGVVAQLRKERSAAQSDIEDVITLVNNAVVGTRALARGLSPVSGERGVLTAALQALATRVSERYGVRVELDTDPDESLVLSESAATHVYRIVQEALTNVIRHSSASDVEIRFYASGGDLHLTVDDNGRGFSQPDPETPGGLGLKIMQYRTRMLGGDLMIDTGVRGGASIHCSFPMATAATGSGIEADNVAVHEPALRTEER